MEIVYQNVESFKRARTRGEEQRSRKPPRYPEQFSHEKRLSSYTSWPHDSPAPVALAKAGFFFTGREDLVRCHQCGIGLKDFSPEDDPLLEHIKNAGNCDFLIDLYGMTGLDNIREEITHVLQYQDKSPEDILTSGIDNITLGRADLEEHRRTCTEELGFLVDEYEEALLQLRTRGNILPTLDDLINCIGDIQKRREIRQFGQETVTVDTPVGIFEENARLKDILKCYRCNVNGVNALFLPCTHHRICMDCASKYEVTVCPFCDRPIREIIKTFMD